MYKYLKESIKYMLRSYPIIRKYVKEVDALYEMTPEQLRERNNKRFLEILHIAYNKSPFYHKLYDEAGVDINAIRGVEDIEKLPIINKEMVREHASEILTKPKWLMVKAHTSGTTGTPLLVYETWPSIWREQATAYCYRRRIGIRMGKDVAVSLRGHLDAHETQLWIGLSKTLYLSSYALRLETTEEYYHAIVKRKPKSIDGYPSALYTFACNLEELGLSCNIPFCFTSSESLLDYQRQKLEKVFNTQVFDIYGTTERTIKLVECFDHKGYFETPGYSINEYQEDGEVTTSLINEGFPIIRYRGNDIIVRDGDKILGVDGRASACIYGKDGTAYSGAGLTLIVKYIEGVENAQLVQEENGKLNVNIVLRHHSIINDKGKQRIMKLFDDKIGLANMEITINQITADKLLYTKKGKFNFVVNEKVGL